jgi:hypothetical protein
MAKQTVSIPIGKLDTSAWPDSAAPGTFRELNNVVNRRDGFFERRSPWTSVAPASAPSNAEVVVEHADGVGIARTSDSIFGYKKNTSSWSQARCGTVRDSAGALSDQYFQPRASVRSDTLLTGPDLRQANTNVIESLVVGGVLWIVYSTETYNAPGRLFLAAYEVDSAGKIGMCVRPETQILGTIATWCHPKMAMIDERLTGGLQYLVLAAVDVSAVTASAWDASIKVYTVPVLTPTATPTLVATLDTWTKTGGPYWDITTVQFAATESRAMIAYQLGGSGIVNNDELYVAWINRTGAETIGSELTICGNRGIAFCSSNARGANSSELMTRRGLLVAGTGAVRPKTGNYCTGLYHVSVDCTDYPNAVAEITTANSTIQVTSATNVHRFVGADNGYVGGLPVTTSIWWSTAAAATSTSRAMYFNSHAHDSASLGYANPPVRHGMVPLSRAVYRGNPTDGESTYVWAAYCAGNVDTSAASDLQQAAFLVTAGSMTYVASAAMDRLSFARGNAVGAPYPSGKSYGGVVDHPASIAIPCGGNWSPSASTIHVASETGVSYGARTVSLVTIGRETEADATGKPANTEAALVTVDHYPSITYACSRTTRYNRSTLFPGAKLAAYDSFGLTELGFALRPEAPALSLVASGVLDDATLYSVYLVFVRKMADGTLLRSSPSEVSTITTSAANQRIQVDIQPYYVSDLADEQVEIYVATGAGAPYLQSTVKVDNFSRIGLATNYVGTTVLTATSNVLYTYSGELPNDPTKSGDIVCLWNNRLWVAGGEDRGRLYYSKELTDDTGVAFSDAFYVSGPGEQSDITGLCGAGDRLYIFKKSRIYVLGGDGPDNFGDGAYTTPDLLTESSGTIYPASIVLMDDGVAYADQTGLKMIDLGGNIIDIGAPLNGLFDAQAASTLTWGYRPVLPIGQKIPTEQSTAWVYKDVAMTTTKLLVHHDRRKTWTTWTLPGSYGGANQVWLDSSGKWTWLASKRTSDGQGTIVRYNSESAQSVDDVYNALQTYPIATSYRTNRIYLGGPGVAVQIHQVVVNFSTLHCGATPAEFTSIAPYLTMRSGFGGKIQTSTENGTALTSLYPQSEYQALRYTPTAAVGKCTWFELDIAIGDAGRAALAGIYVEFSVVGGLDKMSVILGIDP